MRVSGLDSTWRDGGKKKDCSRRVSDDKKDKKNRYSHISFNSVAGGTQHSLCPLESPFDTLSCTFLSVRDLSYVTQFRTRVWF